MMFNGVSFTDDMGTTYEPFVNGFNVGYKVTKKDGRTSFLVMNPSGSDDTESNVFIYHDDRPDSFCNSLVYLTLE